METYQWLGAPVGAPTDGVTNFGLKRNTKHRPPSAIHTEATTSGWLEVILVVMYPTKIEAGTCARLCTLE